MPFVTYYGYCHSLDGATLFYKVDSNKLRFNVKNEMALICVQFDADLINISKVTNLKPQNKVAPFLAYLVYNTIVRGAAVWVFSLGKLELAS